MQSVENSPDWSSTAVFITFDDCGCFYDQVPPPKAPDGTQEGPRMPLIIVSPYAKPGYTDTTPASFASILAYTEHTFGLPPLEENDAQAYDFSGAFNYSQAPLRSARMVTRPLPVLGATPPPDPGHAGRSNLAQHVNRGTVQATPGRARRVRDGGHLLR